jgi:protein-disulfide isomerase
MQRQIKIMVLIGIIVLVAAFMGASYYRESVQSERKSSASGNNPLVRPDSQSIGAADAPITLVEFYDPECESCREFHPRLKRILKDYDGKIRFVARYMPLHSNSVAAAVVTEAAGEQGKYWEMQEVLFKRQSEWSAGHGSHAASEHREPPTALFERYALELGLNVDALRAAAGQNRYALKVERDRKDGQSLGVSKTPTFFVNGRMLARFSEADLRSLINEELGK